MAFNRSGEKSRAVADGAPAKATMAMAMRVAKRQYMFDEKAVDSDIF
jgi:hypothetical protein